LLRIFVPVEEKPTLPPGLTVKLAAASPRVVVV
jgi:hypothetical protein